MEKYKNLIIGIIAFIVFIGMSIWSYNYLINKYQPTEIEKFEPKHKESTYTKAKDFVVFDGEGKSVKLSDYIGKPIIVNFWATWCNPCKSELPAFENAYKEYNDKIEFMMVNLTDGYQETIDTVNNFITNNQYTFPVYFDTKANAADVYAIYSIPKTVFIDKEGNILYTYVGAMSEQKLKSYIKELIGDIKHENQI